MARDRFTTLVLVVLSMTLGWSLAARPAQADPFEGEAAKQLRRIADDVHRYVDARLRDRSFGRDE